MTFSAAMSGEALGGSRRLLALVSQLSDTFSSSISHFLRDFSEPTVRI
jgi:hypothetical protein